MLRLEVVDHLADDLALEVVLRAAEIARKDRERLFLCVEGDVFLGAIRERADDDVTVLRHQLRRHRSELPGEEQVQEERLEDVVAMVAERDLRAAHLLRDAVEDAAAKARAERAVGLSFGDLVRDDRVGVLLDHREVVALVTHVLAQTIGGVPRVALIDVDDDELEANRRALFQLPQHVQHRVAVLAAADADHHAIALGEHLEIHHGARHGTREATLERGIHRGWGVAARFTAGKPRAGAQTGNGET